MDKFGYFLSWTAFTLTPIIYHGKQPAHHIKIDRPEKSNTVILMRTSIILDDELAEQFRAKARERGQSLSAFLADAGRVALAAEKAIKQEPFEVITCGEGQPYIGRSLDKYGDILAADDEEKYGK